MVTDWCGLSWNLYKMTSYKCHNSSNICRAAHLEHLQWSDCGTQTESTISAKPKWWSTWKKWAELQASKWIMFKIIKVPLREHLTGNRTWQLSADREVYSLGFSALISKTITLNMNTRSEVQVCVGRTGICVGGCEKQKWDINFLGIFRVQRKNKPRDVIYLWRNIRDPKLRKQFLMMSAEELED